MYDIFLVNLLGRYSPINLTNGYGYKNGIQFRFIESNENKKIRINQSIILNAFNLNDKNSGFYRLTLRRHPFNPDSLTLGQYLYTGIGIKEVNLEEPIKAKNANIYIVRRMRADDSPNYYYTSDFKTFTQLSSVYPENKYNWITSELITWETKDNVKCQGILYKPANFDPQKKYPVIFHYYEQISDRLHAFLDPAASSSSINIPYYVSNGYLIITPDIHYKLGYPGLSTYNSIVSAAQYISQFPWVDSTKMGLQGESFGGYETLYIISQTKMFAAASAASGLGNFISAYGSLKMDGESRQSIYEVGQSRVGYTPWERQQLYLENSPLFYADKIVTPVLLNNNEKDPQVPFSLGVEFFTALRRLGKKAWMLQYDGQGHWISDKKAALDYTIRMKQFFDHYLKEQPAPLWMTKGIPAKKKGITDGLEYDYEVKTPGAGLINDDKIFNVRK